MYQNIPKKPKLCLKGLFHLLKALCSGHFVPSLGGVSFLNKVSLLLFMYFCPIPCSGTQEPRIISKVHSESLYHPISACSLSWYFFTSAIVTKKVSTMYTSVHKFQQNYPQILKFEFHTIFTL